MDGVFVWVVGIGSFAEFGFFMVLGKWMLWVAGWRKNSPCLRFALGVKVLDFHALGAICSSFAAPPCDLTHILHEKKSKLAIQQY